MATKISKTLIAFTLVAFIFGQIPNSFIKTSLFEFEALEKKKTDSQQYKLVDDLQMQGAQKIDCDVVVVGGGAGGTAAAIQSARLGAKTCLIEKTDWLGGMVSSAGVTGIDGDSNTPSGIYKEFLERMKKYYDKKDRLDETKHCMVSYFCFEPGVADKVLKEMASNEPFLTVYYNSFVDAVYRNQNVIEGVRFHDSQNNILIAPAKVTIDATDFGDIMYMANVPFDLGVDSYEEEAMFDGTVPQCIQPLTFVAVLQKTNKLSYIPKPTGYKKETYACTIKGEDCPNSTTNFDMHRLNYYGNLPGDKLMINIPSHSFGNDFYATDEAFKDLSREDILQKAKNFTLGYVYYMQRELGFEKYKLADDFGTADKLAKTPYVRESRRLQGVYRLKASEIMAFNNQRPALLKDSIAIGDYPIDIHYCERGKGDLFYHVLPFQIPYWVTVPKEVDGFLVTEKNISVSHIANGSTRLQPVVMNVGQAVGAAAALSFLNNVQPRYINVKKLQQILLNASMHIFYFRDVPLDHFAYKYIAELAVNGVITGYDDYYFRPNDAITKAEFVSLIAKLLHLVPEKNQYKFDDYVRIVESAGNKGISAYFTSPEEHISRAEISEIIAKFVLKNANGESASLADAEAKFADVDSLHDRAPFIYYLRRVKVVADAAKFRPDDSATRGEAIMFLVKSLDLK